MHGLPDPFGEWRRAAALYRARHGRDATATAPARVRPLNESELEIWRGIDGAMNPNGQAASVEELAQQRAKAEASAIHRRMQASWNYRNLGEDR